MIPIVVITLFILILLGIPVAFSIMIAGFAAAAVTGDIPLYMAIQRFIGGINSFSLMAVPLFIMAGNIMSKGGIANRIVDFCSSLFSWLRGGTGCVCVGSNMIFAGISGSGTAAISAIGSLTAPALVERGYSRGFTGALVGGAGSLGPVIPPSCDMIVFASITGLSVSRMFIGGVVPGSFIGLCMMLVCYLYAKKHNIDYGGKFNPRAVWTSFKSAIWALLMPVIIIGGIISGLFTATEAGAIACVYGIIVGKFVYKELNFKDLIPCFKHATSGTAQCMMILGSSNLFGYIFTVEDVGPKLQNWFLSVSSSVLGIMLLTAGIMIIIGMFMESLAAMPVILPIVFPLLQSMGCNMNQFGVMFCLCTIMGGLTPPVGVYLFMSATVAKVKATKIIPWMMVMISICLLTVLIAALWPAFTTFLPNLMLGAG